MKNRKFKKDLQICIFSNTIQFVSISKFDVIVYITIESNVI